MKKNKLIIILTAGILIRLINIQAPLLEFFPERQTQTAEITRNIYVNGWPDFWTPKVRYFTDGEPIPYVLEFPLYNGLVALLYHLFDPSIIWGRITSLSFYILSSIIFYKLMQLTINNQQLTILALIFFAFSPLHILASRSFQPEELALFLLLLAIYKKSWVIFSLAVLTKLPIALFAPVILYASSRANRHQAVSRETQRSDSNIFIAIARFLDFARNDILKSVFSFLPTVLWYYRASKLTVHPAISQNFNLSNWFQSTLWLNPKWHFSLFQIEHIWVLTTLGLFFFWIGFWRIIIQRRLLAVIIASLRAPKGRGNPVFWLVWLASGIFYLAIFNYHAMTHEYYHLFLLPPLSAIAGLGLASTLSNVSKHWSKFIISTGVILIIIGSLSLPAIKKIISAPESPEQSKEITAERYHFIEDF